MIAKVVVENENADSADRRKMQLIRYFMTVQMKTIVFKWHIKLKKLCFEFSRNPRDSSHI